MQQTTCRFILFYLLIDICLGMLYQHLERPNVTSNNRFEYRCESINSFRVRICSTIKKQQGYFFTSSISRKIKYYYIIYCQEYTVVSQASGHYRVSTNAGRHFRGMNREHSLPGKCPVILLQFKMASAQAFILPVLFPTVEFLENGYHWDQDFCSLYRSVPCMLKA